MKRFDGNSGYCRMLGHEVPFSYCRAAQEGKPCFKILDCWFDKIEIQAYLDAHYTVDEQRTFLSKPAPKMATLIDLIEKAKKRSQPS